MQPWPFWPPELAAGALMPPSLPVLAYLDPGTGSYALQLLLATLFGGMFALKQCWSQCKGWLALRLGAGTGRADAPADRPAAELHPSNAARPRAHGQPTAEAR